MTSSSFEDKCTGARIAGPKRVLIEGVSAAGIEPKPTLSSQFKNLGTKLMFRGGDARGYPTTNNDAPFTSILMLADELIGAGMIGPCVHD